jgi:hypothetical protein
MNESFLVLFFKKEQALLFAKEAKTLIPKAGTLTPRPRSGMPPPP